MGGRRLTPGQAVDALSEAIDVIRGVWDQGERARFEVDGEYYHVSGAKRGPAPAHNIPIWIGALKPRMLRLIGRKGDGWLPSLAYLKPGDLAAGNRTIDESALAAGRDPREIRRLVNIGGRFSAGGGGGFLDGPAAQWVEQLLPLRHRRRRRHVHPRERRPRHDAALRRRGRAGAARGGRAASSGTRMPRPSPRPPGSVAAPRCARSAARASTTTRCPRRSRRTRSSPATPDTPG